MRKTVPPTTDIAPPRPACCSEFPFRSCPNTDDDLPVDALIDELAAIQPECLGDLLDIAATIEVAQ